MPHQCERYTRNLVAKLCCFLTAFLLLTVCRPAEGQNGTVSGTVRSAGSILSHASVEVIKADGSRLHASSDDAGRYRISLAPGEYTVLVRLPGYTPQRTPGVRISSGTNTTVDSDLPFGPPELTRFVITAARRSEKALDVAGTVSVVDEEAVRERVATSPLDYVESTPGVDMAVQGLEGRQVVAHGFSGTFGPSLLLLSDYRNAALPSTRASLSYFLTPNGDDIDRVEVVRGPASALYGSNAADGVVHFITKSPFDSPGTNISATAGGRSLFVGTGRYAAIVSDKFAWKLSGTYFRGTEWLAPPQPSETIARDPTTERVNGELRADYRITPNATAVFTAGSTIALRNVDYTTIGAYQLDHSRADFAQLRLSDGSLFAQVYMNRASSPEGTTTNLQTGQSALDHSNVLVAQVQHGLNFRATGSVIYGVDVQRTDPQTEGTVNGRNESHDKSVETGAYAQLSAPLASRLQLIAAARVDKHSQLDNAVFSPRIGFVFTPTEGQRFRVSYNRAFSAPTPGNFSLDVVAAKLDPLPYSIRAVGVPRSGFQFRRDCGGLCMTSPFAPGQALPLDATLLWPAVVQFLKAGGVDLSGLPAPKASDVSTALRSLDLRSGSFRAYQGTVTDIAPLVPTITNSLEAGYKGLVGKRLVFDAVAYMTRRQNFIAPLAIVTPNVFLSTPSLAAYLGRFLPAAQAGALAAAIGGVDGNAAAAGIPLATVGPSGPIGGSDILLSYHNVGDVKLWGADVSGNFTATDRVTLSGAYSFVSKNFFEGALSGSGDLATNSPRNKALASARYREPERDASVELRGRYVEGFRMVDGVWNGRVKTFTVADIEAGAAIPNIPDARFTVTVQNALDNRHSEFVSAPILGRLVMARLQYKF